MKKIEDILSEYETTVEYPDGSTERMVSLDDAKMAMTEYAKEVHWEYKKWIEKIVDEDGLMGQYKYMTDAQLFDEFFKTIA